MGVRKGTLRMQSGFGSAQVRRPAKKPQSGSFQRQYPGSPPVFRRAPLGAMRQFGRSTELSFKKMRKYPAKKIEISFFLLYNHWVNEWRVCVNPVAGTARVFFLVPGELPPLKSLSPNRAAGMRKSGFCGLRILIFLERKHCNGQFQSVSGNRARRTAHAALRCSLRHLPFGGSPL